MSPGQLAFGGVVSWTVTSNEHMATLPATSVAAQFTSVVPILNPLPEEGTHVGVKGWPSPSTAVTLKLTGVNPPVHSAVTVIWGQVMVGGWSGGAQLDVAAVRIIDDAETRVKAARPKTLDIPVSSVCGADGSCVRPVEVALRPSGLVCQDGKLCGFGVEAPTGGALHASRRRRSACSSADARTLES